MMRRIATFRDLQSGVFCTLTLPGDYHESITTFRRQLQAFFKRLRRLFADVRCIWRVEYKTRLSGVMAGFVLPHVHLILVFDGDYVQRNISAFRAWLSVEWNSLVAPDDVVHLAAGTQADIIQDRTHAMRYVAKYSAKADETATIPPDAGRHWGYWGEWDTSEFVKIALSFEQFRFLKVYVANYLRSGHSERKWRYGMAILRAPPVHGFTVLGLGDLSNNCTEPLTSDIMRLSLRI